MLRMMKHTVIDGVKCCVWWNIPFIDGVKCCVWWNIPFIDGVKCCVWWNIPFIDGVKCCVWWNIPFIDGVNVGLFHPLIATLQNLPSFWDLWRLSEGAKIGDRWRVGFFCSSLSLSAIWNGHVGKIWRSSKCTRYLCPLDVQLFWSTNG